MKDKPSPYIDPKVKHIGVSRLREYNGSRLSNLKETIVIQDGDNPVAVLVPYETYMAMQCLLSGFRDWASPEEDEAWRDLKEESQQAGPPRTGS